MHSLYVVGFLTGFWLSASAEACIGAMRITNDKSVLNTWLVHRLQISLSRLLAMVQTCLKQWWLTGYRQPGVDKDLRVPCPALLVPVEPLGFFGSWILDEALTSHDWLLVHAYQPIAGHINASSGTCPSFWSDHVQSAAQSAASTGSFEFRANFRTVF